MKPLAEGMNRILSEGALTVLREAKVLENQGRSILHFEIGQPDFPTPDHVKSAGIQGIADDYTRYTVTEGIPEFVQAIQKEIEITRGYTPDLDQILALPGGKPGIYLTMISTVNPGEEIIFPDPGFPTYGSLSQYIGAKSVPIKLKEENQFRLDPVDIEKNISSESKLIILNSPQNPTGSVMTKSELKHVAEIAGEYDCFILSDEIYSKILYEGNFYSVTSFDEASERSIVLDGFSKSHSMTGWRLGYIVGPAPLIQKISTLVVNAFTCTPEFIQRAGIAALTGPMDHHEIMMKAFRARRNILVDGLNGIHGVTCQMPEGAFYAWPNITGTGLLSKDLAHYLLHEAGIACLPGTAFGSGGEGYLRFSYATSIDIIVEAIPLIRHAIERLEK
ncbi:MAG: pyridoxal phosphate-dependent aminotransferase [Candidatus Thorarchaeota archaeon]|nr:MAG: pyridoxal phosphate-dependent aminotransferase [Candidatus Thorarchaeota archaeon]